MEKRSNTREEVEKRDKLTKQTEQHFLGYELQYRAKMSTPFLSICQIYFPSQKSALYCRMSYARWHSPFKLLLSGHWLEEVQSHSSSLSNAHFLNGRNILPLHHSWRIQPMKTFMKLSALYRKTGQMEASPLHKRKWLLLQVPSLSISESLLLRLLPRSWAHWNLISGYRHRQEMASAPSRNKSRFAFANYIRASSRMSSVSLL